MDTVDLVVSIVPTASVVTVMVIAFVKRKKRRSSPLILNPYTRTLDFRQSGLGDPPPPYTTSQPR